MKTILLNFILFTLLSVSNSTWSGEPRCGSDKCILACINNFDTISDTSTPAKMLNNQCNADIAGMSLDAVCKNKGFKGVAAHSKNFADRPPLWCPDTVTY